MCNRIVQVTDHGTRLGSQDEFSSVLLLGYMSTCIAAELPKVMERSCVQDFDAVIVVRGLAECMHHLLWSSRWCLITDSVGSFRYAFIWGLLVEVDCGTDCVSPNNKWHPGVKHHRSFILGDGLDHAFCDLNLLGNVVGARMMCCTTSSKHLSEGPVVGCTTSIISLKLFYFISSAINLGLKWLVGCGACFRLHIWEDQTRGVASVIINE